MAQAWTSNILCRYFMNGTCQRGSQCQYAHDPTLARPRLPCKFYQRGTCAYGSKCRYLHEPSQNTASSEPAAAAADPCRMGAGSTTVAGGGSATTTNTVQTSPTAPTTSNGWVRIPLNGASKVPSNWAEAPEFVPSFITNTAPSSSSAGLDGRTYASVTQPLEDAALGAESSDLSLLPLCPYAAVGECRYGEHCVLLHGDVCELCHHAVLHPHDPEQQKRHRQQCLVDMERDMEHSFRMAKSVDKMCGICMEIVTEKKELNARRFGILPSCNHCFCVACIRHWRSSTQFEAKVTRGCPECRVHSDFICPSRYWVDSAEEKKMLIESYIQSCSSKPCKHFREGKGECPFGNKCFYRHTYPDGRQAELGPPRRRRRQNQLNETELMPDVLLSDFLEDEVRMLAGYDTDEEDEAGGIFRLDLMMSHILREQFSQLLSDLEDDAVNDTD